MILHNIFQWVAATDGFFPTYPARFLPAIFASFLAKPLKYTRTQMPSECPLSRPFSNEFSFGLVPFPVRLLV